MEIPNFTLPKMKSPPNLNPKYSYNRVILIGNGFDLSLDLKTSYNNFICSYIKSQIREAQSHTVDNNLIYIPQENSGIIDFIQFNSIKSIFSNELDFVKKIRPKGFLKVIIDNHYKNDWVDIEELYFQSISEIFNSKTTDKEKKLIELNSSFEDIINLLTDYLLKIEKDEIKLNDDDKTSIYDIINTFLKKQDKKEIINFHRRNLNLIYDFGNFSDPEEVLIVNFNYTNSIKKIVSILSNEIEPKLSGLLRRVINIHGDLMDESNPVVFGYGNESHFEYKSIESTNNNNYLKYFKSFHYPKTFNYQNLLNFIDSNSYEVFVYGHSCGISDKTILNSIFENENCKSIRIFYFDQSIDGDDHFYKNMNISRVFEDKSEFRSKIQPRDPNDSIYQIKK